MASMVATKTAATNSNRVNFEYLCRVCAINTKKNNTEPECVYILKTPNLKDKLQKFLYLTVLDYDDFPKVLCITCFRKVEATASLSRIAKQTQREFREFVQNMKIPVMQPPTEYDQQADASTPEYVPLVSADLSGHKQSTGGSSPVPSQTTKAPVPPPPLPAPPKLQHKDEVVVNVSINDPLTRETQHKMLSACQKQGQKPADARYAPLSIAQRAFTTNTKTTESATLKSGVTTTATAVAATHKAKTPGGVINFFHGRQGPQVTTYSSGGYMIGHAGDAAKPREPQPSTVSNKQNNTNNNNTNNINSNKLNSLLNKRKLQVTGALRASTQTGQVSLLKVSQKPKPKALAPKPLATVPANTIANTLVSLSEEEAPEALPKKIIIASTKPKRDSVGDSNGPPMANAAAAPPDAQAFPEDISLGKVIKDNDLLRLILKALKWPLDKKNIEAQINRLKGSKFTVIMSDPNLLHDTDLTQILGPYLRPAVIPVETMRQPKQQQQQQQLVNTLAAAEKLKQQKNQCVLTAIPYKLPAETSVQLVPASPDNADTDELPATSRAIAKRSSNEPECLAKPNRPEQTRDAAILISDEEDDEVAKAAGTAQRVGVQRITITRNVRAKANNRCGNRTVPSLDDDGTANDDIVLMEHASENVPATTVTSTTTKSNKLATNLTQAPTADPQITRPIIKRRKVNDMSSSTSLPLQRALAETSANAATATSTSTYVICTGERPKPVGGSEIVPKLPPMPPLQRKPTVAFQPQEAVQAAATVAAVTSSSATEANVAQKLPARKLAGSKAALGQQLLEAIGLPKKMAAYEDATAQKIGGQVEPIQQIRTALKRSLKQAQEQKQKQRKHEEPIIQDADSTTTKHSVKEVLVEAKLKNSAISSTLDLEEQIDKIELVVQCNNANEKTDTETEKAPQAMCNKTAEDAEHNEEAPADIKIEMAEGAERVPRKRGRKRKEEKLAMQAEARRKEEEANHNNNSGRSSRNTRRTAEATDADSDKNSKRPVRASKTMSKYYKAPEKASRSPVTPTRTTRNRH